ncbi:MULTISPECIES: DUF2066 domain-containing protein [unclassified Arsukibacterium]|uniref:DUF2066 domain-containing protein n=1 Tax=unclassified Arsukibacterium TaxID=2635278 RepID=UPI000C488E35|nr:MULTISPECIES: DUF2066 domain-containing protein [unclassified Arsukibacterium]MAA94733.1 hypothetical protein [Rheinheimera sp.]MBM33909.1 hypothetical protein [Rheinheimera sp.]HAW93722.1 hypothetical protein [Candidatus Azambacteria bacterium]|tara:strand:+ start:44121 stop:45236 length:1116 start_codon:yes stop_codon:yes gene_type:complete
MALRTQAVKLLLATLFMLCSNLASAVEVSNLYVADVSADQSQRQWQSNALTQVITRLTGMTDLSAYPAIANELDNAGKYVKQFESVRSNGTSRLKVLLDAKLINVLLQQQGIAIWGAHRPEILVWIVQQQAGNRFFLRQPDNELVQLLRQSLVEHGIPVTLPLYDMDDLMVLTETDVWAGFWQAIGHASNRYRPDMIMTLALDDVSEDGEKLMRLSWQRQSPVPGTNQTRIVRNEITAAERSDLVREFSATLTGELAAEQAVVLQAEPNTYHLAVTNLQSLADVVAVETLLNRVLGVASVTLSEYSANEARFAVNLQIDLLQLTRILQWEPALILSPTTQSMVTGMTERSQPAVELNLESRADTRYMFIRR